MGLRGKMNKWIISYLVSGRKLQVKLEAIASDIFEARDGTPQGSSLGSIIFNLYVDDLPEYLTVGKVFTYADDTSVLISGKTSSNEKKPSA
ncbi:hypothetical protein ILUMI_13679 [Ignelater luminosus]|uniref:Reverse transcriptase domain-containing protein n=1 Tax=Ignelater luminosus TaxID=2038154 RepID=A0A8K0CRV3_IGNLU|nr:hypothetical protein ILUMI_13679 [Ignelater luminosus]